MIKTYRGARFPKKKKNIYKRNEKTVSRTNHFRFQINKCRHTVAPLRQKMPPPQHQQDGWSQFHLDFFSNGVPSTCVKVSVFFFFCILTEATSAISTLSLPLISNMYGVGRRLR